MDKNVLTLMQAAAADVRCEFSVDSYRIVLDGIQQGLLCWDKSSPCTVRVAGESKGFALAKVT